MRRESDRTLFSLSTKYQRGVDEHEYDVIAIDNGSKYPLTESDVTAFGDNFTYEFRHTSSVSPATAINHGVQKAKGDNVMVLIDGARILSPGVLYYTLRAFDAFADPFVFAIGMHLGHDVQNKSMLNGYNQAVEDRLLEETNWKSNGYELFRVSSLLSSKEGFFSRYAESNCISLSRNHFLEMGGFDERFTSPGGGIVNLDFFNRLQQSLKPVMLLGEATFHQFHGGVATNQRMSEHPWRKMVDEYNRIKGVPYESVWQTPEYLGHFSPECLHLCGYKNPNVSATKYMSNMRNAWKRMAGFWGA